MFRSPQDAALRAAVFGRYQELGRVEDVLRRDMRGNTPIDRRTQTVEAVIESQVARSRVTLELAK